MEQQCTLFCFGVVNYLPTMQGMKNIKFTSDQPASENYHAKTSQ